MRSGGPNGMREGTRRRSHSPIPMGSPRPSCWRFLIREGDRGVSQQADTVGGGAWYERSTSAMSKRCSAGRGWCHWTQLPAERIRLGPWQTFWRRRSMIDHQLSPIERRLDEAGRER